MEQPSYFQRHSKREGGEESKHLCTANTSQETAVQCTMEEVCNKHTSSENLRLFLIKIAVQIEKKYIVLKVDCNYDSKNYCFLQSALQDCCPIAVASPSPAGYKCLVQKVRLSKTVMKKK